MSRPDKDIIALLTDEYQSVESINESNTGTPVRLSVLNRLTDQGDVERIQKREKGKRYRPSRHNLFRST